MKNNFVITGVQKREGSPRRSNVPRYSDSTLSRSKRWSD